MFTYNKRLIKQLFFFLQYIALVIQCMNHSCSLIQSGSFFVVPPSSLVPSSALTWNTFMLKTVVILIRLHRLVKLKGIFKAPSMSQRLRVKEKYRQQDYFLKLFSKFSGGKKKKKSPLLPHGGAKLKLQTLTQCCVCGLTEINVIKLFINAGTVFSVFKYVCT